MSSLIFNQAKNIPLPFDTAGAPASDFFDVVSSAFKNTERNTLSISKSGYLRDARLARENQYKELTGRNLHEDIAIDDGVENPHTSLAVAGRSADINTDPENSDYLYKINNRILKLRKEDPAKYGGLKTNEEIQAELVKQAKDATDNLQKNMAGADDRNLLHIGPIRFSKANVAGFVGSMGAEFTDPVNLMSLPLGAAKGAGVMRKILTEAGVNVLSDAAREPEVAEWQKEVGNEYGWKDMAENMGMAGLMGAGMAGVGHAFGVGVKGAKEFSPELLKSSANLFERIKAGAKEAGAPSQVLDVIEQQAREAHLSDANPMRDNPHLDTGGHVKSLEEVQSAIREGRPIKTDNLGVSEAEFHAIDTAVKSGDSELKANRLQELEALKHTEPVKAEGDIRAQNEARLKELMAETGAKTEPPPFNPKEDYHPDIFPDTNIAPDEAHTLLEASDARVREEFSPQNVQATASELDDYLNNAKSENLQVEIDGKKTDAATLKKEFAKQKSWIDAIRVCSIGGGS